MTNYRTDLAMERTLYPGGTGDGIHIDTQRTGDIETTWVRIETHAASERFGKPQGVYWTLIHHHLPYLPPEDRIAVAKEIAQMLRLMLPPKGDILVLGLGNRRMTADALGDRTVSGVLVTRHLQQDSLRSVCAMAPGVLGVTGMETAELAQSMTDKLHPAAVVVIDALAAMETSHICTTVQVTDTGICPGSGVGNHRQGIDAKTLGIPVIAIGIPMVVYSSTIVRDALKKLLAKETSPEQAEAMAAELIPRDGSDLVVTPRNIDELVQCLGDMLALAINSALQPDLSMEELSYYLH